MQFNNKEETIEIEIQKLSIIEECDREVGYFLSGIITRLKKDKSLRMIIEFKIFSINLIQ